MSLFLTIFGASARVRLGFFDVREEATLILEAAFLLVRAAALRLLDALLIFVDVCWELGEAIFDLGLGGGVVSDSDVAASCSLGVRFFLVPEES